MKPTRSELVVCLGDSITRGKVSVDYVRLLNLRANASVATFINGGVNGDLAINVQQRLDPVIALRPAAVTVLVGTNDARAQLSEKNARALMRMKKLPTRPTIEGFAEHLGAIVNRLTNETSARVGLLSIPVLGQELGSQPVRCSMKYSGVVKHVAHTSGAAYLPLNERQIAHLTSGRFTPGTAFRDGRALAVTAAMQHLLLRRPLDSISRRRELELTTDHVHQNTKGAIMIADLIEQFTAQRDFTTVPGHRHP
jgi:hypothetical protein